MTDDERRINLIEYGKMIEQVRGLTNALAEHAQMMSELNVKVAAINERLNTGKGVIFGLLIAAGGLGAGVSEAIKHLTGK